MLALRDTNGDGVADVKKSFGPGGGTGIALRGENLYFATATKVVRWRLPWVNCSAWSTGNHRGRIATEDTAPRLWCYW